MAGCVVLLVPALALTPVTIALRNAREKLPKDQQNSHPVAKAHEVLGSALFFCAANVLQGPGMIVGAYHRSFGKAPKPRKRS